MCQNQHSSVHGDLRPVSECSRLMRFGNFKNIRGPGAETPPAEGTVFALTRPFLSIGLSRAIQSTPVAVFAGTPWDLVVSVIPDCNRTQDVEIYIQPLVAK